MMINMAETWNFNGYYLSCRSIIMIGHVLGHINEEQGTDCLTQLRTDYSTDRGKFCR